MNRAMAHRHTALLGEPCEHCKAEPHPLIWPSWLIVMCEAAFLLCLAALVWVGVFAVQP